MLLFIGCSTSFRLLLLHFNTSHVTVYPTATPAACFPKNHFNTSHVTVYPSVAARFAFCASFQYISCYCLSRSRRLRPALKSISIHLMLLFINSGYIRSERLLCISIHLMLLFIGGGDS